LRTESAKSLENGTLTKNLELKGFDNLPGQIEINLPTPASRTLMLKEDQQDNSNMKDENQKMNDAFIYFNKCIDLNSYICYFCGIKISHDWQPHKHIMFYFVNILCCFGAFSIIYTMYIHTINRNYLQILEPLAISGINLSVI